MNVTSIIYMSLMVLLGGMALWYKSNATLSTSVTALIASAEDAYKDLTKAGGRKFEWVTNQLYMLIPAAFRPFVPRSLILSLVQSTFDAVQGYAVQQLNRLAEKGSEESKVQDE